MPFFNDQEYSLIFPEHTAFRHSLAFGQWEYLKILLRNAPRKWLDNIKQWTWKQVMYLELKKMAPVRNSM